MTTTESEAADAKAELGRLGGLQGKRAALGELPADIDLDVFDQQLKEGADREEEVAAALGKIGDRIRELEQELPKLRDLERRRREALDKRSEIEGRQRESERGASFYSDELAKLSGDDYDADRHQRVRAELVETRSAAERCAVLHDQADGLEVLEKRLAEEQPKADRAQQKWNELEDAQRQISVTADAVDAAKERRETAEELVAARQKELEDQKDRCRSEAAGIDSAERRLAEARRQKAALKTQAGELMLRQELALALHEFREQASKRARPTLESETGMLLGRITRGRYAAVTLTESYQLEVLDDRVFHSLARFSGGERDLAAVCLRLALSRTLARQRGADTGFILLDEVFGSQDPERRVSLLEQLHVLTENEFRQIFVISHTPDVVDRCDAAIEVRLVDGVSQAETPRAVTALAA